MEILKRDLAEGTSAFMGYSVNLDWQEWSQLRTLIRLTMLRAEVPTYSCFQVDLSFKTLLSYLG